MSTSRSSSPLPRPTGEISSETSRVGGERLLTVKEAAASLGLCVDSVRRHLRSGKLQGVRVGGGWRVPESKLAVQLGLLSVAALPVLDVVEDDHKHIGPKSALVTTQTKDAGNELLDTILETRTARVRVLQLVEAAAIAADIPSSARAQLARELEFSLNTHNEERIE